MAGNEGILDLSPQGGTRAWHVHGILIVLVAFYWRLYHMYSDEGGLWEYAFATQQHTVLTTYLGSEATFSFLGGGGLCTQCFGFEIKCFLWGYFHTRLLHHWDTKALYVSSPPHSMTTSSLRPQTRWMHLQFVLGHVLPNSNWMVNDVRCHLSHLFGSENIRICFKIVH